MLVASLALPVGLCHSPAALLPQLPVSFPRGPSRATRVTLAEQDLSGTVLALDFDGVLCDSEPELTRSAWRAARERWPELMESAASMSEQPWKAGARKAWAAGDGWEPLQGNGADGLPNWLAAKMRLLRPVLETGYESVCLMRLCVDEAVAAQRGSSGSRPLTLGEITSNWGPEMRDSLLARYGLTQQEAIELYSQTRDEWLAEDEKGWLRANTFYPGAIEAVREAADAGATIYIVTTKSARYTQTLLRDAGLELEADAIFGLGSGPKVDTLSTLQQKHPEAQLAFVEDRLETLRTAANDPRLFGCRLFFAEWGYSTAEQQALVGSMPRVRALSQSSELPKALCNAVL